MPSVADRVVVVGGGLAGACAANALKDRFAVTVVESRPRLASAASGAAAGLANPFSGRRATPAWRMGEALAALAELLEGADAEVGRGILRPATSPAQRDLFHARAESYPEGLDWVDSDEIYERWPDVAAPMGGLWVRRGSAVDIPELITGLLANVELKLETTVTGIDEQGASVDVHLAGGESLRCGFLIVAPGDAFRSLSAMAGLPLGRLKGQTIRVRRPADLATIPLISGRGYIIPDTSGLVLGTTHERVFLHDEPTDEGTRAILERASRVLADIEGVEVLERRAGVRVTVPPQISHRRLPFIGPLPGHSRAWGFVGLGSRGLLTAPLLAKSLPEWLKDPDSIDPEVRLRIASGASA